MFRCSAILILAVVVLPACSKEPERHVAWKCWSTKDVMALRVGSRSGSFESISFDGGGLAIHLRRHRPFAPDFDDVVISTSGDATLDIVFRASNEHLVIENVGPDCIEWLKTNKRLNIL